MRIATIDTIIASAMAFVVGILIGYFLGTDPCADAPNHAKCVAYMNDNP